MPRIAVFPGQRLFDPGFDLSQGPADSVYDSLKDDHDGGESAGVASGFDPAAGNLEFQFGEIWVGSRPVHEFPFSSTLNDMAVDAGSLNMNGSENLGTSLYSTCTTRV